MNIPIDDMNAECERKTTIARDTNSRANAMQAIKEDAPVMKAWNNYKSSDEFKNTRKWALHEEHVDGSLWAAFYAGFFACAVDQVNTDDPQQPTSDDVMAALLFCLWHHQGGNSKIGQPIRLALGIGQDEPLTDEQLAIAERVQSALCASASNSAVKVQACRTEDREMLATDAGKELLTKAAAALSAQQQSPVDPVIRDICELDPADPDDANTVSVSVDDLRLILNRHVHPSAPHSASQPDTVAVPREQLEHWAEYWNGNANEKSMTDALEHILDEIDAVLQAAQEAK